MKFASKQDIEAPIAFVHQTLTDFETWERAAMRRGADVVRSDALHRPQVGMSWLARFKFRGKPRAIDLKLTQWDAPLQLGFTGGSTALTGEAALDLIEMSQKRTRLHVTLEVVPKTISARLFLQSLRLARGRVDRSFDQRAAQLAAEIERRFKASSAA